MIRKKMVLSGLVLGILLLPACWDDDDKFGGGDSSVMLPVDHAPVTVTLNGVSIDTWMYQIQGLGGYDAAEVGGVSAKEAIDTLAATDYDMLVVEPGHNFKYTDDLYDTGYLVSQLKQKPNGDDRVLLAYVDIGEAEDYRDYWDDDAWVAPIENSGVGSPDFLVTIDPNGWSGNYPVAYWDTRWKDIWTGAGGIIAQLVSAGFHGVYLDWIEAYDDDYIIAAAADAGKNPAAEMMSFIEEIRAAGETIDPDFLIIAQNAPYLLDDDPSRYSGMIDAIATEDTWFYGEGDVEWDEAGSGDLAGGDRHEFDGYSTANRIAQNQKYLAAGVPVFSVDYCISKANAHDTYINALDEGFVPVVSQVSLSRLTETALVFSE